MGPKDKDGETPLHKAPIRGHEAVVKLLLDKDSEPGPKDKDGLYWAVRNGHEAVVKLLLDKDAEPGPKDKKGRTPLHRTAEKGHEAVIELLQPFV
jgi:ankyrin repeat protein